jgi:hypothetical protein
MTVLSRPAHHTSTKEQDPAPAAAMPPPEYSPTYPAPYAADACHARPAVDSAHIDARAPILLRASVMRSSIEKSTEAQC